MISRIARAVSLLLIAMTLGCGDNSPVPGSVSVSLETPNLDDGALVITVTGSGITGITPTSSGYQLHQRLVTSGELRIVMFGNLSSGPLFTASVPDTRDLEIYSASVVQAASRTNELQDLAGYSLVVESTAGSSGAQSVREPVSP